MSDDKHIPNKSVQIKELKNFSEVDSMNRLTDKDSENASTITAGGDRSIIEKDVEDSTK